MRRTSAERQTTESPSGPPPDAWPNDARYDARNGIRMTLRAGMRLAHFEIVDHLRCVAGFLFVGFLKHRVEVLSGNAVHLKWYAGEPTCFNDAQWQSPDATDQLATRAGQPTQQYTVPLGERERQRTPSLLNGFGCLFENDFATGFHLGCRFHSLVRGGWAPRRSA